MNYKEVIIEYMPEITEDQLWDFCWSRCLVLALFALVIRRLGLRRTCFWFLHFISAIKN